MPIQGILPGFCPVNWTTNTVIKGVARGREQHAQLVRTPCIGVAEDASSGSLHSSSGSRFAGFFGVGRDDSFGQFDVDGYIPRLVANRPVNSGKSSGVKHHSAFSPRAPGNQMEV